MKIYKDLKVPIKAGKDFCNRYGKDEVIIVSYNKTAGVTWITTWGRSLEDCKSAAESGNNLKKALGWPEPLCHATPNRLKRKGINL
jgi:hypothetical protein